MNSTRKYDGARSIFGIHWKISLGACVNSPLFRPMGTASFLVSRLPKNVPMSSALLPMEYITVFDIANAGYKSHSFPEFGLIFVAAGSILVAFKSRLPNWSQRSTISRAIFPYGFLGFSLLWTMATFFGTYRDYRNASDAERTNTTSVVEGQVTDFRPMPVSGHAMERFCVSGKCFEYSDYVVTAGFNNTSSHGGPIRENLPVRVTYVGNTIVKLEKAK